VNNYCIIVLYIAMKWMLGSRQVVCLLSHLLVAAHAFAPYGQASRLHTTTSRLPAIIVLRSTAAAVSETVTDGLIKTVTKPGQGMPVKLGDIATVKYSCYLPNDPKMPPFSKSNQQKVVVGDGTMITGWDKAIRTMKIGERALVRITDPALAYGAMGLAPLIPPGAEIEVDLEILDSQPPMANIDFDDLAMADNTPVSFVTCLNNLISVAFSASPALSFLFFTHGWFSRSSFPAINQCSLSRR
jgi:FKBP-type peptidyl-prolyl cis-trans isomerase